MQNTTIQKQGQLTLKELLSYLPASAGSHENLAIQKGIDRNKFYRDKKKCIADLPAKDLAIYVSIYNEHVDDHLSIDALLDNAPLPTRKLSDELNLGK